MIRRILVLCFILSLSCPAHAVKIKKFKPLAQPSPESSTALQNPANQISSSESYPKITQLEYSIFKKSYEKQNIYSRLNRLEKKIFNTTYDGLPLANRVDNLMNNIDSGILYGITSKDLAKLETKVLGRTYMNDDTESRITRMEKEMLGAMQGGNLKDRYDTIKTASKHYNSYPEIVQSQNVYTPFSSFGYDPYYSGYPYSTGRYRRSPGVGSILNSMANRVMRTRHYAPGGMLTGFTPPLYDNYRRYSNPGFGHQQYYWGNRGGFLRNRNFGNGASVRILD